MSLEPTVRLEVSQGVGVIRLNRPPLNIMNRALVEELSKVARSAAVAGEVRAVVIWGGERCFSTGADINELASFDEEGWASFARLIQAALREVARIPKPTIAAISGYALGGGCELAICADFRYAAETASIGEPEVALGLIPGGGGTQRLPRLIGISRAKEMVYSGRTLRAARAAQIGLVDEVHPPDSVLEAAMESARRFAEGPASALAAAKRIMDEGMEAGLAAETEAFISLYHSTERREGLSAFLARKSGARRRA